MILVESRKDIPKDYIGPVRFKNNMSNLITWYKNGSVHRDDGPALELPDGECRWIINNHLHREDGPAIIKKNGTKHWFLHGNIYTAEQHFDEVFKKAVPETQKWMLFNLDLWR